MCRGQALWLHQEGPRPCLSRVLPSVLPEPRPPSFVVLEQLCWLKDFKDSFPAGGNVLGLQKLREVFG